VAAVIAALLRSGRAKHRTLELVSGDTPIDDLLAPE